MEKSAINKAKQIFFSIFSGFDRQLGLILLALAAIGFFTFLSASQNTPVRFGDELRNLALSFAVMWIVSRIPPKWLEMAAVWIYGIGVALLIAVAAFGLIKKGARRWLNIGFVIQPSELMKIAMPLMLAWYFQKREGLQKSWDYGVATIILVIPVFLIARQPDLGTALLVFAAGMYVIILAGLPWKWILPFVGLGAFGIILIIIFGNMICAQDVIWPFVHDYQKHRVCTLLDPEFIPEKHTDFVFAVFSEEFGLLGNLVLLALFFALIKRGLAISASAPNLFTRLLGASVTLIFFTYAFVNIGMVSGLLPVVGVPLPFISYGGTALVTLGFGAGILMSIHRHRRLVQS
jgi:rod shape determining protein RodA